MKAITAEKRNSNISGTMSKGAIYLTFALSDKEYGIELLKIRKIVGITTPVPMVYRFTKADAFSSYFFPKGILFSMPYYVKGIIRLHEKIVPIIDLRLRLGFQEAEYTIETCIIIVDNYDKPAGIIVDKLLSVNSKTLP
jgi:purine-binding chemotaxis protein CheW